MSETTQSVFANSFQIAWDYLEATGELGNPDSAPQHLLDTIEAMILHGERRQLLLANKVDCLLPKFESGAGPVDCLVATGRC
jgi:hypothetical protein